MSNNQLVARLYKRNKNKSIQVWEIHTGPDFYITVSGKKDGQMTHSAPTHIWPKRGKTLEQQLRSTIESKIKHQKERLYCETIEEIDRASETMPGWVCMTAQNWKDQKDAIVFPCVVQPKLDGNRCLVNKDGAWSRNRKQFESADHILKALEPLFRACPRLELDGELYNHDLNDQFEDLSSLIKKTKKHRTEEERIKQEHLLQYWIYDVRTSRIYGPDRPYIDRFVNLIEDIEKIYPDGLPDCIKIIPLEYSPDVAHLEEKMSSYMQQGYEGGMVRNTHAPYESTRSVNLLKYKIMQDDEFKIVGVKCGKGSLANAAGSFTMINSDGKEFDGKLIGSHERLRWIYQNPSEVIGKMATVKFQNLTAEGIPRFPVVKAIRGLEDRSDWT